MPLLNQVLFDRSQSQPESAKSQARANIGISGTPASQEWVAAQNYTVDGLTSVRTNSFITGNGSSASPVGANAELVGLYNTVQNNSAGWSSQSVATNNGITGNGDQANPIGLGSSISAAKGTFSSDVTVLDVYSSTATVHSASANIGAYIQQSTYQNTSMSGGAVTEYNNMTKASTPVSHSVSWHDVQFTTAVPGPSGFLQKDRQFAVYKDDLQWQFSSKSGNSTSTSTTATASGSLTGLNRTVQENSADWFNVPQVFASTFTKSGQVTVNENHGWGKIILYFDSTAYSPYATHSSQPYAVNYNVKFYTNSQDMTGDMNIRSIDITRISNAGGSSTIPEGPRRLPFYGLNWYGSFSVYGGTMRPADQSSFALEMTVPTAEIPAGTTFSYTSDIVYIPVGV